MNLLYKYATVLAISLSDLAKPADVEPMHVQTFG
jgi:hypothetical protein